MGNQSLANDITLGDILRMSLPLDTVCLAGSRHANRPVRWVAQITSWEQLPTQVATGDLVMVSANLQNSPAQLQLKQSLAALAALDVAGLLMFAPLPPAVREKSLQLDLAVLVAPSHISPREAHRAIVSLLLNRQTAANERSLQLYRKLSDMSREGRGLPEMTAVMSRLTGKIIVVQDKRLEIRAISVPDSSDVDVDLLTAVLQKREHLPEKLRNRKAAARAQQSYWQQLLPIENMGRLISPIVSGDRARGYLSVIGPADQLDLLDSLTAEHGAAACALEMAKAKAVSEAKKALRGDFLEGLLAGTMPEKEIKRLAGRLDHDTKQPHAVLIFTWAGQDTPSLRRLETAVNWVLTNHSRATLLHIYGDQHICLFQALKDADDMEIAHTLARRLGEQVSNDNPGSKLIGGLSGPAHTLADWPRMYGEALQAMQLGQRLQLSHVVDFNSLGVYRLLGQLDDVPVVRTFTQQVIGPLVQYDKDHRSALVQTLDAYFNHHGNISQTAETLYIHRNTLLYRLERIQELTGHDLARANMRLALHLALKFWQLQSDSD